MKEEKKERTHQVKKELIIKLLEFVNEKDDKKEIKK